MVCSYEEESRSLSGELTFTYYNNTGGEISVLPFNLFANAYREGAAYAPVSLLYAASAYYGGASYGGMTIEKVENALTWEIGGDDKNILFVTLESPVRAKKRATVTISFTVTLAQIDHRTGVTRRTVSLCNFYPVLCAYDGEDFYPCVYYSDGDPFYTECADYTVAFTAPKGYVVACSGVKEGEKRTVTDATYRFTLSAARDFAIVMSEEFQVLETEVNGATVSYYYYDDGAAEQSLQAAAEARTYYAEHFGAYGYGSYSVVQSSFCYGGMEYPALSIVSDALSGDNLVYTIAHETAHQWWYAMVGNNPCDDAWMDEGLAEYAAALFLEENGTYGFSLAESVQTALSGYRSFYSVYRQIFGEADTTMHRNLGAFISEYEYVNIAYRKGMVLFHTVREAVGTEKFLACLKRYYRDYLYEVASADDLIACFQKSGMDVSGIFASFIDGTAIL